MIMSDYVPLETSRIPLEHVFKPVSNGDYLLPYTHINYIYIYITWTCQMINKIQQVTSSNHKLLFFFAILATKLTVAKSHHRLQRGPAVMELAPAPEAPEALRRPDFPRRLRRVRR